MSPPRFRADRQGLPRLAAASGLLLAAACAGTSPGQLQPDVAPIDSAGEQLMAADQGVAPVPDARPAWPDVDPVAVKEKFDRLVAFAQTQMQRDQVPGAAIALLVSGKLAHVEGLGFRRKGGTEAVTGDSLFALGSVSKVFAGATALALSQQGVVDLHLPISTYLPQVSFSDATQGGQITLHHLLTHTSGLGYANEDLLYSLPIDWTAEQSLVDIFTQVQWPIWAPAGAVWNYSNAGYSLAGAVMQRAAGQGYFELVTKKVLRPLGMSSATLDGDAILAADHTWGHSSYVPDPVAPDKELIDYFSAPSNWVFCSARGLARFAEILLAGAGPAPLSADGIGALVARHTSLEHVYPGHAYGYGLEWIKRHGVDTLGHGGSNFGWTADLVLVPSQGIGLIALMNSGEGNPFAVTSEGVALFAQGTGDNPDPGRLSAGELAALAGTYADAADLGDVTVSSHGVTLEAKLSRWNETVTLQQYGVRAFYGAVSQRVSQELWDMPGLDVTFYLDSAGQGEYLVTRVGVGRRQR